MAFRVVFVCSGNTCRSPMAEMIFNHRMAEQKCRSTESGDSVSYVAESAGTNAVHGQPAAEAGVRVLRQHGVETYNHASKPFDNNHAEADLILTMTDAHRTQLVYDYPHAQQRIFSLLDFAGEGPFDVPDPFMQGEEAYLNAFRQIHRAIDKVIQRLNEHDGPERFK